MSPSKVDARVLRHRASWHYRGQVRPDFALDPGPGQESVWDYPRPPRLEACSKRVEVRLEDEVLAASDRAMRVLETASPPTVYVPIEDVLLARLVPSGQRSFCEWKGEAVDYDLRGGPGSVAWAYPDPYPEFASIAGWLAFYPSRLQCTLGGERVRAQPGGYYGGWLTDEIVGPVKGEPGCDGL